MSINKITLLGTLGGDPQYSNNCCKFSVATSNRWKDKNTGEQKEETQWHSCTAWNLTGENISKWFKKGERIYLEGEVKYSEKDGKYYTNIIVNTFQTIEKKQASTQQQNDPNQFPDTDVPF